MDNSTNNKNIFQSELPCEKKNGHSIIQEFINNYPYGVQDLIKLLECGYQITYEDRKIMKEQFPADTYKYYATFSRLAFKLYQEGQAELITTLITSGVDLSGTIYTIEALLSNKPEYFSFQTNVWVCIANNAITHYKNHWIFCEAALKQSGKWEEVYKAESFLRKHNKLDKNEIITWKKPKEYKILKLLYPQLQVPAVRFLEEDEQLDPYQTGISLFHKTELSDMLETLSMSIEKERPVWGYHHIAGATAEAKINTLWHTFPHEEFLEALFYLADHKHSSSILNLLIKEEANEIRDAVHAPNTLHKLQTGLEVGRIYHPEFLLLLWELGYRHKKTEDWQKDNSLTNTTKMRLYCLDKLFDNTLNIDLKEILTSSIIQAVCLIEDIRNNRITFTNHPNWKSRINSIRSASNHLLNNYWGYIDMALDNFHTKEGQSMRTYLCQKEPGIKLDNKEETIVKETNLYKALTILYPDIYN